MQDKYMQRYNFIKYKKACVNNVKEDITLCIDGKRITLKVSQIQGHQGIQSKKNISISIYNDKIICITSITTNEQNRNYIKDVNEEIECTNKVRYIILRKIRHGLFKVCKKKTMKLIKRKTKNKKNKKIMMILIKKNYRGNM